MVVPAIFVTDELDSMRFSICDKIVRHTVAVNYKLMCYQQLPKSEIKELFIRSFILDECNFNKLNQEQKLNFLNT